MGKEKKQQTPDKQQKDSRLMFFSKSRKKHKKLFIVIIILLVLAIGGGGFFIYTNFFNKSDNTNTSSEIKVDSTLSTKASEIAAKNGYSAGQEYLDQALKSASNDSEKATVYTIKAALSVSKNNETENNSTVYYDEAKDYSYKAEELDPTAVSALSIAVLEESTGDLEAAIQYYQLYIDRGANSYDDTQQDSDIDYYQNHIQMLKDKL